MTANDLVHLAHVLAGITAVAAVLLLIGWADERLGGRAAAREPPAEPDPDLWPLIHQAWQTPAPPSPDREGTDQ